MCALLVWPALAGAITVRNADFEEGEKAPSNWTLTGEGSWSEGGAAQGRRCVIVRGNGKSVSTWRSDAVALEPEGTYVLSVRVRRVEGSGGVATIGPPFANFDLHDLTDQWKRYEVIFRTPTNLKREESYLRLGQWHMNGAVGFDEVEVREAEGEYREISDENGVAMKLGDGEVLRWVKRTDGEQASFDALTEYRFDAPLGSISGNEARTLDEHTAGFNTNRWVFSAGQRVTYQHRTVGHGHSDASVDVSVSYYTAGRLVVEATADKVKWVQVGSIEKATSTSFRLPEFENQVMGIFIRLRADPDKDGRAGMQVNGYTYRAKISSRAAVGDLQMPRRHVFGLTRWPNIASAFPADRMNDRTIGHRVKSTGTFKGLWWCSSGEKVSRSRPLPLNEEVKEAIRLNVAANESEAVQLVFRPADSLLGFKATASDLVGPDGSAIRADHVDILRVEYVGIMQPTDSTGRPGEWPDPLPAEQPAILDRASNHVLWVRVNVPKGTRLGDYKGEIYLRSANANDWANVPLVVHVYGFELPDRLTCSTAFGFSPSNVFKYHRLEKIEDRRAVLEKYWANFAAHHISPYDPAPLDPFKITWPKKDAAELSPTIDWTRWDAAMERALNVYHFNSFMLRVQGLGGGTFHERVDPSLLGFPADSPQYRALMKNYLGQLQEHLKEKGWLDRAFVYWFDEPDPKDYDFVNRGFARLKEDAPLIRRMLTEQVEEKLIGGPNIWCPVTPEFNPAKAAPRMAAGEKFWWYVCTGPKAPYATLFIDHPATELRVWLWQTWQRKINGILVWETNYWTSPTAYPDSLQDPWEDPMSWQTGYGVPKGAKRGWGNGDGRFIYPPLAARDRSSKAPILEGPVDSIRWEMLRDGLEDYEYLAILQRLLKDRPDPEAARLLEVPESITRDMTTFTKDPTVIETRRDQIAKTIERLSKP